MPAFSAAVRVTSGAGSGFAEPASPQPSRPTQANATSSAADLLNRWIIPLEHQSDYLTLHNGQKIRFPFRLMLIVATNLDVSEVVDPAFLRRIPYKMEIGGPKPEEYRKIFKLVARNFEMEPPDEINYAAGLEFVVESRLTIVGDVLGRSLRDAGRIRHHGSRDDGLPSGWLTLPRD